jgi:type III secretion protein D
MSYELHVLQGQQQGARTQVPLGRAVSIGADFDSDIVLRDTDVADRRATLTVQDGQWIVDVLHGELETEGRVIAAGERATLPLGTALAMGGSQIVVQRAVNDVHTDDVQPPAAANGDAPSATAEPDSPPPTAAGPAPAKAAPRSLRHWGRRLAVTGGALTAACAGLLAFAYNIQPKPLTPAQQAQQLQAQLRAVGLAGLAVQADASAQSLLVQGHVATTAERDRGQAVMQKAPLPTQWKAWVGDQAALQVQDVFRTHGIEAQAQAKAVGAVHVTTSVADPSTLDAARAAAQRDVPGLSKVEIANTLPPPDTRGTPVNDPGKRVSSIVPGDPPYVVTADGTRYFQGAVLPTGHRIHAIEKQQVLLEINGVTTSLPF